MEKTINQVFVNRVKKYGDRTAIEKKQDGNWKCSTWNQYYEFARSAGLGFSAMGFSRGDRVAIVSENCLEWLYTDMGALGAGLCVVPVYPTLTAQDVGFILENSDSRGVVVENCEQMEKVLSVADLCPSLEKIVVIEDCRDFPDSRVMGFRLLIDMGAHKHRREPDLFLELSMGTAAEDLATIVYTSGTTGRPKGVMITHGNIMSVIDSLDRIEPKFGLDSDLTVPFLPLSHVFERVAGHYYGMYVGLTAAYAESIQTFAEDVRERKPTIMLAVPRVCEKVYQSVRARVRNQPKWKQALFGWGHDVGIRISELREKKKEIPFLLDLKYRIAYRLVFKRIADVLGGRVRWMTASGAPTSREIVLFFNATGITVIEGYGMTECCAPATMSSLSDYRIGTAGKPLPGVEIKIADDGEILVRGDNVFSGYWKLDEETRAAFTEDGFLRSGDLGHFDDGFLTVTGRKKNIIITSGGKNISPRKIEGIFLFDPLFSQFLVVGDRRKYLTALVNVNMDEARTVAEENGISWEKETDLLCDDEFLALVRQRVEKCNGKLSRFETIKDFQIVEEFSQENGEMTVSMKLKRNVIVEKYKHVIDQLYDKKYVAIN